MYFDGWQINKVVLKEEEKNIGKCTNVQNWESNEFVLINTCIKTW